MTQGKGQHFNLGLTGWGASGRQINLGVRARCPASQIAHVGWCHLLVLTCREILKACSFQVWHMFTFPRTQRTQRKPGNPGKERNQHPQWPAGHGSVLGATWEPWSAPSCCAAHRKPVSAHSHLPARAPGSRRSTIWSPQSSPTKEFGNWFFF